tara:strand:- start:2335 stop:2565 length:231 start_codon:yes stop_codon:yes gene_type:complete
MTSKTLQVGMRVRNLNNDLTALIVGPPEYYTSRAKLVRIKYENSTRYEYQITTVLDLLPLEDQYPAHGGTYGVENV